MLERGTASFEVRPGGPRRWQIECGLATVEIVGTRFTCARSAGRLHIGVEHGVVLVRGERVPNRARRLAAGESLDVLDATAAAGAAAERAGAGTTEPAQPAAAEETPAQSERAGGGHSGAGTGWRELARNGRHREAFATLGTQGIRREAKRLGIADLFALADVARLSGHPADAVGPLQRIIDGFPSDPQAPLAAFALGRLELDDPRPAAGRGRRVQTRAGDGRPGQPARQRARPPRRSAGAYAQRSRSIDVRLAASFDAVRPPQGNHCARRRRDRSGRGARRRHPRHPGVPTRMRGGAGVGRRRSSMRCASSWQADSPTAASSGRAATPPPTPSRSRCRSSPARRPPQHIDVPVDVTATQRTFARQVSLADLPPEARPRALALAVAELIRSAGESPQPEAPPPAPVPTVAPERQLLLSGDRGRRDPQPLLAPHGAVGPARRPDRCRAARWQISLDAGAATSRNEVNLGDLRILLASATLFAGPRFVLGPVIASVGPAGTLGWARIEGQSGMPGVIVRDGSGLVSTVGLRAAAEGPASSAIRLLGYLEGGITVLSLEADVNNQPAAGVSGPYFILALGARLGPS